MSVWQSTPDPDRDIAPCDRCGKDVDLNDLDALCVHGTPTCDGCESASVCAACFVAVMDSEGWREADPLWQDPTQSRAETAERTRLPGFDPRTNSYAPRKDKSA